MSFISRKLLTKIYDLNIPTTKSNKKKNGQEFSLFRNKINSRKFNNKIISEINKTEKGKNIKLKLDNSNKTIEINKFPVIPKLNIKNIKIKENKILSLDEEENMVLLDYKLIESSSEDSKHPLRELKNGSGWISERFCQYPQYIYSIH